MSPAQPVLQHLGHLLACGAAQQTLRKWMSLNPTPGGGRPETPTLLIPSLVATWPPQLTAPTPPGLPNTCRFRLHSVKRCPAFCHKSTTVLLFKTKFKHSNERSRLILYTHFFNTWLKFSFLTFKSWFITIKQNHIPGHPPYSPSLPAPTSLAEAEGPHVARSWSRDTGRRAGGSGGGTPHPAGWDPSVCARLGANAEKLKTVPHDGGNGWQAGLAWTSERNCTAPLGREA